jgi:Domain of unknown function (DUF4365)
MSPARTFDPTERQGVNAVDKIFTDAGWIFRPQLTADFGVDAQVELTKSGRPSGQLLAIQIKSGTSYFRAAKNGVAFYVDDPHMGYWSTHFLPMVLVIYNPETEATLWQWANYTFAVKTRKNWRLDLPLSNVLDRAALSTFGAHLEAEGARRDDRRSGTGHTQLNETGSPPDIEESQGDSAPVLAAAIASSMEYYRTEFEPRFQFATRVMQAVPSSSIEEIRNAFGHLSAAGAVAFQSGDDAKQVESLRAAHLNIERAKRHLAFAAYDSVTTTIAFIFQQVTEIAAVLEDKELASRTRRELLSVERKLKGLSGWGRHLETPELIEQSLAEADKLLVEIERLYLLLKQV